MKTKKIIFEKDTEGTIFDYRRAKICWQNQLPGKVITKNKYSFVKSIRPALYAE